MRIDLDAVPLRESGMTSYEIMLSESQERMLFIVKKGHEKDIEKIFNKWDLHGVVIGEVEDGPNVRASKGGKLVADVPSRSLVLGGDAPVYIREAIEPGYIKEARNFRPEEIAEPRDYNDVFLEILGRPSIASKRWVFEQYDTMVRTNTVVNAGHDAAIIRLKDSKKGLALKTDCNARFVYLNPRRGAQIAVAEAARNVCCVGAKPIAITNCLNFGNPYDPGVFWQFKEAVAGIGEACRVLETPVTGGNVSFYNESPERSIYPTPVIGMLGLLQDYEERMGSAFKSAGDVVLLLGLNKSEIGGSEYLAWRAGAAKGDAPELNLETERKLQALLLDLIHRGLINSAHDVAEGGIAVALAESLLGSPDGLGVELSGILGPHKRLDFNIFSESQSMVLVSAHDENRRAVMQLARAAGLSVGKLGRVNESGRIDVTGRISVDRATARMSYEQSIPRYLGEVQSSV
ncbi:MAG: purL [Bacteroidetes bacterium]|nr:purL [Bacteroidota bacterium]